MRIRLCLALALSLVATAAFAAPSATALKTFDARYSGDVGKAASTPAAERLDAALGAEGVVELDPTTETASVVADRSGSLTLPSALSAKRVALNYASDHESLFGLEGDELADLKLTRSYSSNGITHLTWQQRVDDVAVYGADLRAAVADDGRLMTIGGAPVADLPESAGAPDVSAARAVSASLKGVEGTERGADADLVLFPTDGGTTLGWRTTTFPSSDQVIDAVVDADTGALLRRTNTVNQAGGLAFDYYPGAPTGGTQTAKTFSTAGNDPWLTGTTQLKGNNAWAYSDVNDDIFTQVFVGSGPTPLPGNDDFIPPSSGTDWNYTQQTVTSDNAAQICPPAGCTWAGWDCPDDANSWQTNMEQAATQAFYFVNTFHDHLRDAPGIDFSEASGNFEQTNSSGQGRGNDVVHVQVVDGANTGDCSGMPDPQHQNNGFASTFPDGYSMRIQFFLFSDKYADELDFLPGQLRDVNPTDTAALVYHEYGHGLSNRLITQSDGTSGLDGPQADAMGEAWSDWYAMDYLVDHDIQADTATNGELFVLPYLGFQPTGGKSRGRSEGLDCPVGSGAPECPGSNWGDANAPFDDDAGVGGYTYGDFGKVRDLGAQVHHDGEIWGQTLWDLRKSLVSHHGEATGLQHVRALVTEGMRLAPVNPSYLDVRDAMLIADSAMGLGDHDRIWNVFAARGMGLDASADGSFDEFPQEDFDVPTDNLAPETSIDSVSVNRRKRSAKVSISGVDPAPASLPLRFRCRVDAKPYGACNSPQTFKRLKYGTHTVDAVALDAVFNADGTPATRTFKVKRP